MKKLKIFFISMLLLMMPLCVFAEEMVNELDKLSPNIEKGNNNTLVLTWGKNENYLEYQVLRSTKKTSGFKKIATVTEDNYTDTKLTYGTTYYYKIVGVSEEENITSEVKSAKVVPNKVENVKLKAGNKQITVTYNKTSNTGYEIYRSTDNKKWSKVTTISRNKTVSYTNKRLSTNKTYYYKVRAYSKVKGKKIYGSFSDVVSTKTAPSNPTVSNIKAANYKEIDLTIKKVSGVTYYEVQRSTNKKKGFKTIGSTESLIFNDEDINPTVTYYYKVRACNENNTCGSYSKVYNKKTSISKPTLKGNALSSEVILNWNNISYANGYELYYSKYKNKKYSKVTTTSELTANKTSLTPGKTYYFKVRTYVEINSKKYYSSYSNIVSLKPTIKKPALNSEVDANSIRFNIKKSNYNENYQLQMSTSKNGKYTTIKTGYISNDSTQEDLTFTKTDLKNNTTYYFKIRGFIKIGKNTYYSSYNYFSLKTLKTPNIETFEKEIKEIYNKAKEQAETDNANYNFEKISYGNKGCYDSELTLNISNLIKYNITLDKDGNVKEFKATNGTYNYDSNEVDNLNSNDIIVNEKIDKVNFNDCSIEYLKRNIEGKVTIGDEIKIGNNEEFYVIETNENETKLLAKYGLDVDRLSQSKENSSKVGFSNTNYWSNKVGNGLKYSGNYDGNSYPYVYDSNSSLYSYINKYLNKLFNNSSINTNARLMSQEEGNAFINVIEKKLNNSINTWLGSARSDNSISILTSGKVAGTDNEYSLLITKGNYDYLTNVNPVVIIPTNILPQNTEEEKISFFEKNINEVYNAAKKQIMVDTTNYNFEKMAYGNDGCYDSELTLDKNNLIKYYILLDKEGNVKELKATNGTYNYDSGVVDNLDLNDINVNKETDNIKFNSCDLEFLKRNIAGKVTVGDEIKIGNNEEFYVIETNENETKLIAKYGLNIDRLSQSKTNSSKVKFSNTNYWSNKVGNGLEYSGNYDGNPYPYVYDLNSNLYSHITKYLNKLFNNTSINANARLISLEECEKLISIFGKNTNLDIGSAGLYLSGTAKSDNELFYLSISNLSNSNYKYNLSISSNNYNNISSIIKPVVIIPTNILPKDTEEEIISFFEKNIEEIYNKAKEQAVSDIDKIEFEKISYGNDGCYDSELTLDKNNLIKYNITIDNDGNVKELKATNGTYNYDSGVVDNLDLNDINVNKETKTIKFNSCSINFIKRNNDEKITVGDEIKIGNNEVFYVIDTNDEKTKLFAKYSLDVDRLSQSKDNASLVKFSDTNYWYENGLKSEYSNEANATGKTGLYTYPAPYIYDNNSNIYSYINMYINKLFNNSSINASGSLMSFEEYSKANKVDGEREMSNYALGSAYNKERIYYAYRSKVTITDSDEIRYETFTNNQLYNSDTHIRPVVEVKTSDLIN